LFNTQNNFSLFISFARSLFKSLFKFIQEEIPCFFYPIKIGDCINFYKLKPNVYQFLGDKRSIENIFEQNLNRL